MCIVLELDGLDPFYNRPSTKYLFDFFHLIFIEVTILVEPFGVFLFSLLYSMDMFGQSPAFLKQRGCISSLDIKLTCVLYQYGLLDLYHS